MPSAVAELAARAALAWIKYRPFSAEARERRKQKRRQRREARMAEKVILTTPTGETVEHTPPIIAARTSTKVGVTGLVVGLPAIQYIQDLMMPWPWLEQFTNSDLFAQLATLALAYLTARLSKSPLVKQAV
jgi:hypothetical protein